MDLDRLLAHIEGATTHHQLFGLDPDAPREQIDLAFRDTLAMLFPPYSVGASLPAEMLGRIGQGFNKAAQAFCVLASIARRRDYDAALPAAEISRQAGPVTLTIHQIAAPRAARVASAKCPANHNRRRTNRYRLALPVRIVGYDHKDGDKWTAMSETLDISRIGLRLRLKRPVREEAMTEKVSRTGPRVIVRAAPPEFDLLRVTSATRQCEGLATLRNRFCGKDGLERLCLQFLDKDWPV